MASYDLAAALHAADMSAEMYSSAQEMAGAGNPAVYNPVLPNADTEVINHRLPHDAEEKRPHPKVVAKPVTPQRHAESDAHRPLHADAAPPEPAPTLLGRAGQVLDSVLGPHGLEQAGVFFMVLGLVTSPVWAPALVRVFRRLDADPRSLSSNTARLA